MNQSDLETIEYVKIHIEYFCKQLKMSRGNEVRQQTLYNRLGTYTENNLDLISKSLLSTINTEKLDPLRDLLNLLAWLALRKKANFDVLIEQLEMNVDSVDQIREGLRKEIPLELRNKATRYLDGWIEDEDGETHFV